MAPCGNGKRYRNPPLGLKNLVVARRFREKITPLELIGIG